jgi:hypothetical protein
MYLNEYVYVSLYVCIYADNNTHVFLYIHKYLHTYAYIYDSYILEDNNFLSYMEMEKLTTWKGRIA